ncbi:MAG: ferric reductase-like transmembrane domain-containing protein [Candidatus Roizmanbacteria bacterium]
MIKISEILYKIMMWVIYGLYLLLIASFLTRNTIPWGYFAPKMGIVAIVLLWIVVLPGIFKRFRVKGLLQKVQIILMKSRRRIGVSMFLCALIHYSWMKLFIYIDYGLPKLSDIPVFELFGLTALLLLLPLFITSNNYSVRLLKSNWDRVHLLIYGAMWFAAFHTSFNDTRRMIFFGIPTIAMALLQTSSRIYDWNNKKKLLSAISNE